MTRRTAGMLLAVVHAALVGSLGLKLLVDRALLPRAWIRTQPFDPSTPLRGRYVRLWLEVPVMNTDSRLGTYASAGVRLAARDGRVVGWIDDNVSSPRVLFGPGPRAGAVRLAEPVAFFIPEHVPDPSVRPNGEELWAEVTLPGKGPPRPIRLGTLRDGRISPLELR